jgi:hypothetical protein
MVSTPLPDEGSLASLGSSPEIPRNIHAPAQSSWSGALPICISAPVSGPGSCLAVIVSAVEAQVWSGAIARRTKRLR